MPAEKIMETLNQPKLKLPRDKREALMALKRDEKLAATPSFAGTADENPNHREDFISLLDAAVRGKTSTG